MQFDQSIHNKIVTAMYGEGYGEGLPELPDNPPDGIYYWRRATANDRITFVDKAGNRWVECFEWSIDREP